MKVNLYKLKSEEIEIRKKEFEDLGFNESSNREILEIKKEFKKNKSYMHKFNSLDIFKQELNKKGYISFQEVKNNFKKSQSRIQFFLNDKSIDKNPEWLWIAQEFSDEEIKYLSNPKAILLITYKKECYVYSLGSSYHVVDKYCDRDFAFKCARKLEYVDIKLSSTVSPHSNNNKRIDSFVNNKDLIFDSGEAYTKLNAKVKLKRDFNIFKENIEIGTSLKFTLFEDTIENLLNIIIYLNKLLKKDDKTQIPLLKKVSTREKSLLSVLNNNLVNRIKKGDASVSFSEFEIKGTTEYFYSNPDTFILHSGLNSDCEDYLDGEIIQKFIKKYKLEDSEILKIKIATVENENEVVLNLIELLDYVDDREKCVLISGVWYKFNTDYQMYLEQSLNEITIIYDERFNYNKSIREKFIEDEMLGQRALKKNDKFSDEELRTSIENTFYRERVYNKFISNKDNDFENYDRDLIATNVGRIELADIYHNKKNDETIYAVKMGSGSASLSYVVNQSEASLELYRNQLIDKKDGLLDIKNVGIWIVLDRKEELKLNDVGTPDINCLNMFILKNRLDEWKKKVRLMGLNPIIRINYIKRTDELVI